LIIGKITLTPEPLPSKEEQKRKHHEERIRKYGKIVRKFVDKDEVIKKYG